MSASPFGAPVPLSRGFGAFLRGSFLGLSRHRADSSRRRGPTAGSMEMARDLESLRAIERWRIVGVMCGPCNDLLAAIDSASSSSRRAIFCVAYDSQFDLSLLFTRDEGEHPGIPECDGPMRLPHFGLKKIDLFLGRFSSEIDPFFVRK